MSADEPGQTLGECGDGGSADLVPDPDGEPGDDAPRMVWTRADWWACLAVLVGLVLVVVLHTRAYTTLSPIDELQHVDYVAKAGRLHIPRENELVGFAAMSEAACRGVDAPGYSGPACGLGAYEPGDFQEHGINTAANQFPAYYLVTGLAARPFELVGFGVVTSARLVGAVWAAGAWAVLWYCMALRGVERRARAVVVTLLAASPLLVLSSATVNADACLLLTGSLALLATFKFEAERLPWWALALAWTGLMFVEPTNLLVIAACAAYLAIRVSARAGAGAARRAVPAIGLALAVLVRMEFAGRIRGWLWPAVERPPLPSGSAAAAVDGVAVEPVDVTATVLLEQIPKVFTPIGNTYLSPPLRSQLTIVVIQLTNWLLIGLLVVAAVALVHAARTAWLARLTIAALIVAGPFYTWYYDHFNHQYFGAPGRFGLPLIPPLAVAVAVALRRRPALLAAAVLAGASALQTLQQLVRG